MKQFFFSTFLLVCLSCDGYKQTSINDNRITVDLDNPQKSSLFDYFKHIELIPLETSDDVLIGNLAKINYHQGRYYAFDRKQFVVYIFDNEGEFISEINKLGRGPGEYINLDDMIINPFTSNLDLLSPFGSIYSYSLSGTHMKTVRVIGDDANAELPTIHSFFALNENMYVFYSSMTLLKITYFDVEEMKITHQAYDETNNRLHESYNYRFLSFWGNYVFYEYDGKCFFYRNIDNEVFMLGPDSLIKAYTWDFGKYNYDAKTMFFPEEIWNDYDRMNEEGKRFPYLMDFQGQNDRYVMAKIRTKNYEDAYLIFDKTTQKCNFLRSFTESVRFWPRVITNDYVLSYCNHNELEKFINKEILDEINRQKFDALLNEEEEMNPIIIKYYFK